MSEPIRILDMEQKLADDEAGTYRDSLCDALRSELAAVKRHMDSGLTPEEFLPASQFAAALESAASVVERTWKVEHGSGL